MSNITIVQYKEYKSGKLSGYLDINIKSWGITFLGLSHFSDGKSEWVALPSNKFVKDGETAYAPTVKFDDKDKYVEFQKAVISAIKTFRGSSRQSQDSEGVPF